MLTPEEAKARLGEYRVADAGVRIRDRIAKLAPELREAAKLVFDEGKPGVRWTYHVGRPERRRLGEVLDGCTPEQRRAFFAAFVPALADDALLAWEAQKRAPYEWGETRRAFRAPADPQLSLGARVDWMLELVSDAAGFEQDASWWAAWCTHAGSLRSAVGPLLAAVVDAGGKRGEAVLATLLAGLEGRHEIAGIGRTPIRALSSSSRPEGWSALESLLARAQREEGLRQVILESVDLAHPGCFARLLRVVAEHDLARFSSVARAIDVWFGLGWDSQNVRQTTSTAQRAARWIEDPAARGAAIDSGVAEDVYLGLHLQAFEDAVAVVERARPLLQHASAEVRYAVARLLAGLNHTGAVGALYGSIGDPDLRVAALAIDTFARIGECHPAREDVFETLEAQLARWPAKPRRAEVILWPWCVHELDRARIGSALITWLGERPLERLRPHLAILDSDGRWRLCREIVDGTREASGAGREFLVQFLGDPATSVRKHALEAIGKTRLAPGEELRVEALLTRKAEDVRLGLLALLLALDDERLRASTERLLLAKDERQRAAGLELLRRLGESRRMSEWCTQRAQEYAAARGELSVGEGRQLEAIAKPAEELSLDDALGLSPPDRRTPVPEVRDRRAGFPTSAAVALLVQFDEFLAQNATRGVRVALRDDGQGAEAILGNLHFWQVYRNRRASKHEPPLAAEIAGWWEAHGRKHCAADPLELARALLCARADQRPHRGTGLLEKLKGLFGAVRPPELRYRDLARAYLCWLLEREAPAGLNAFLLDAYETALARLEPGEQVKRYYYGDTAGVSAQWLTLVRELGSDLRSEGLQDWSDAELARLWNLERALWQHSRDCGTDVECWIAAVERGLANEEDLIALLLRPIPPRVPNTWGGSDGREELRQLSGSRLRKGAPLPPRLAAIVRRLCERIVEVECGRGEAPTLVTLHCATLHWTGGLATVARASAALRGGSLRRGGPSAWSNAAAGREESLSGILRATRPAEGETPERFAERLPLAETGESRLLEIALYAPQWCAHVEHTLGWPGLAEAVWWIHAHTKDTHWSVDPELREAWTAQTSERTPLSGQDLLEGAVDVAWFERVRAGFGEERFAKLLALAKYVSSGTGHTRAQLFAGALLGRTAVEALQKRIREKRHVDSVRALGLVPLPPGEAAQAEVLARWIAIQEFVRGARQFGSMRQASEKRAAAIGLENLARTAGYPDPVRLEWAMEREALGDLARGSVKAVAGEFELELSIDADGDAQLASRKAGKALKQLPAAAKKLPGLKELFERAKALGQQKSRMRLSLETAMVRGDALRGDELATLLEHPVLAALLRRLVLVGDGLCGYPIGEGRALRDHAGKEIALPAGARLRLAHPLDLLEGGQWSLWQRDCLRREIVQPFKQVFRELYVLTEAEREERLRSRRYAGHQVQPRQALALLGTRGWIWHAEQGVRRVDHASGLAAWIEFLEAPYTPVDVEGLTLESVAFTRRGEWEALPLASIPARLFSEVMRDLDLVVSVANRAGVDPEASASSIEARAALVRETCALLGIANVRLEGRHALIEGKLGSYSLHLGSAVVHKLPGGHLCIVPVHAQHRGRLFLPFADDDPKTAEILSKVLLLARDAEIKDPTILEQIRR